MGSQHWGCKQGSVAKDRETDSILASRINLLIDEVVEMVKSCMQWIFLGCVEIPGVYEPSTDLLSVLGFERARAC